MKLFPAMSLILSVTAAGLIASRRILTAQAADDTYAQGSAAAGKHLCVSKDAAGGAGDRLEAYFGGIVPLELGGNVAPGDALTSDAQGRGIVATVGSRIIGFAAEGGVLGTIGSVRIAPGFGPAA